MDYEQHKTGLNVRPPNLDKPILAALAETLEARGVDLQSLVDPETMQDYQTRISYIKRFYLLGVKEDSLAWIFGGTVREIERELEALQP